MNILHLEASSGWGGQEIRILREAEGMRASGHEVILCVMKGGKLLERACKAGFTSYALNFSKKGWPLCLLRLLILLRKHRIDLINTHSSLDAWIGGIAGRLAKVPVVRTRHLSTPIKRGWNSRWLYGKLADFVVTTCRAIVPVICEQSGKSEHLCRSIPTGIDPAKISKEDRPSGFRSQLGVKESDFLIGTACFMRSWKGIEDFLQAAHLLRGVPEVRWVIIGGGHEEPYRKKAAELNLSSIVHFTGHLEDPFLALRALDVFALLSTAHEGVSQAILQAAYLVKPLIATATGGLSEVCIDRQTGLCVDTFSPQQVARAVLELKENNELRKNLGQNAKDLVTRNFTLDQTIEQMKEVYQQVLLSIGT